MMIKVEAKFMAYLAMTLEKVSTQKDIIQKPSRCHSVLHLSSFQSNHPSLPVILDAWHQLHGFLKIRQTTWVMNGPALECSIFQGCLFLSCWRTFTYICFFWWFWSFLEVHKTWSFTLSFCRISRSNKTDLISSMFNRRGMLLWRALTWTIYCELLILSWNTSKHY